MRNPKAGIPDVSDRTFGYDAAVQRCWVSYLSWVEKAVEKRTKRGLRDTILDLTGSADLVRDADREGGPDVLENKS